MIGRRDDAKATAGDILSPGEYGLDARTTPPHWRACSPNGHGANLSHHDIVEHEDGTITVSPSIGVGNDEVQFLYHGFLERGVWRPA